MRCLQANLVSAAVVASSAFAGVCPYECSPEDKNMTFAELNLEEQELLYKKVTGPYC